MKVIPPNQIISHCELCDKPLVEGELYGPEGFDLCRYHHDKFYQLLNWLIVQSEPKPMVQLSLLEAK